MMVGEIPGDQEDMQGAPFVGPAGRLLDAALEELGIHRKELYVTNAAKHFKWESVERSGCTKSRGEEKLLPAEPGWKPRSSPFGHP
jgi:uracil-DNA glycosylase